jgi:hypothetical protein
MDGAAYGVAGKGHGVAAFLDRRGGSAAPAHGFAVRERAQGRGIPLSPWGSGGITP